MSVFWIIVGLLALWRIIARLRRRQQPGWEQTRATHDRDVVLDDVARSAAGSGEASGGSGLTISWACSSPMAMIPPCAWPPTWASGQARGGLAAEDGAPRGFGRTRQPDRPLESIPTQPA